MKRKVSILWGMAVFVIAMASFSLALSAYFILPNGTQIDKLVYDRVLPYNTTKTINVTLANGTNTTAPNPWYFPYNSSKFPYSINASRSYKDNSIRNPNVYLKICGLNNSYIGDYVDIAYASESGNITVDLLTVRPQITNISYDNSTGENCTTVDVDISAFKALYPAIPFFQLFEPVNYTYQKNVTQNVNGTNTTVTINVTETRIERKFIAKMNQSMNGSYLMGVSIEPESDPYGNLIYQTYLTVKEMYDDLGDEITNVTGPFLIISIVSNNISQAEEITRPKQKTLFNHTFAGTENVFVNGILSLKVRAVDPCSTINETGYYYILNDSAWNTNHSCLKVENVSDIVVDFANKTIDGDANQSYVNNTCAIIIQNTTHVTIRGAQAQQFARGICVINSKNTTILGSYASFNIDGIYVKNSTVDIVNINLANNESEILIEDDGIANLNRVHLATANLTAEVSNVKLKSVPNPPPDPIEKINETTTAKLVNISQWVNVSKADNTPWMKTLTFHFEFPNAQGVVPKVIYKFEYNCTTQTVNNTTVYNCQYDNGTKMEPVYVNIDKKTIFLDLNYTNFSIFAPYGVQLNHTVPEPTPTPTPTPTPAGGGGGGGGGGAIPTGNEFSSSPPRLNLTINPENLTLQQGETGEVKFNLTNYGNLTAGNLTIKALVRKAWTSPEIYIDTIKPGETVNGTVYIKVFDNEIPGTYYIPVEVIENATGNVIDVKLVNITVTPRQKVKRFQILEIPPVVTIPPGGTEKVAILVKNNGDFNLTGIRLHVDFGDKCIESVSGEYNLNVGEKKSLIFTLKAKSEETTCKTIFALKSREGVVAFAPVIVQVKRLEGARVVHILPWLLLIWTIVTIAVFIRRQMVPSTPRRRFR